jgi:hypothetical protein
MKVLKPARYQTPQEITKNIEMREAVAATMPPGEPKQLVLLEIARLRNYAMMKLWLSAGRKA